MSWIENGEEEVYERIYRVVYRAKGQIVGRPDPHFRVKLKGLTTVDIRARSQHKALQIATDIKELYS